MSPLGSGAYVTRSQRNVLQYGPYNGRTEQLMAHTMSVPATRGKMGRTTYYTANFPMGMVTKLFTYDAEALVKMLDLPVEQRTQRELKAKRVPEIAAYILDNDDYLFSSVTVSVNAVSLRFDEVDSDVGQLHIPMEAEWVVNDGQHRLAGIAAALRDDPTLKDDTISVVILPDEGLERSQQVFSDLNRTVQRTSKSLDILFDHRSPLNRITNAVVKRVPLFQGRVDRERQSISARSADFATLAAVQAATGQLLADELGEDMTDERVATLEDLAVQFWSAVTEVVEPWQRIADRAVRPAEARTEFVSSYALALWAVASVGARVLRAEQGWEPVMATLKKLAEVDWRKSNPEWQGIAMLGGEVVARSSTRQATTAFLAWKLGLGEKPERAL